MRIHLKKRNQKKSLGLSPQPLVYIHCANVSATSEGSGESVHCAGSTEPSSFLSI